MSTDWDTLIASHAPPSAPPATDRLQGLGPTTPQDGAIAANHGPSVGLAPDSALVAPTEVKAQANANQWDSIIAAHPAVSSFVGASQTNAALAQNSGPQMANLSGMLSDFAAGTGKWWNRTVADAAADFQAPGLAAQAEVAQAQKTGRWDKLLEGGFGLATALPAGLINNLIAPASRGAAALQPNVLAQTPGPLESTPLPSILTRVLAGEPVFRKDEAQATRDYSTIFNALLMFAPGAKGKIAETGEATPKPTYTPSPEGPSYNPSGFASDAEGNPFYFASTRDPFHQLAAGPAVQLPRSPGLPGQDHDVQDRGRPDRRDGGAQSVRFFPGAVGGALPLRLCRRSRGGTRALPDQGAGDARVCRLPGHGIAKQDAHE